MIRTVRPDKFDFAIVVEFPSPGAGTVLAGNAMRLWRVDVQPEVEVKSCEAMSIHYDAEGIVWAEVLMWSFPDHGGPIYDGKPTYGRDSQIITDVFNVHVAGVLSKRSYNKGYEEGFSQLHGAPLTAAKRMRGRKMVEA